MKTLIQGKRWEGNHFFRYKVQGREFVDTDFRELIIRLATFKDCQFSRCDFNNCYIGFNVRYQNCTWINCRFHGKYMAFGDNSLFENCRFENVRIQSANTDGMELRDCIITGSLYNMIWRGKKTRSIGNMVIEHCDFSGATFHNINIYAGVDVSNVILPRKGIRVFRNSGGSFSTALRTAGASLERDDRIALKVLGNEDCYSQQDPVIFDIPTIEELLKSDTSRISFETVAKRYEVTQQAAAADLAKA